MEIENFNFKEIMEARCHAIEESLCTIGVAELKGLTDELFPSADHPWLELYLNVINDPASGRLYHAMAENHIHVLYCPEKAMGMWFIPGVGKGPLQPEELKIMRGIVEAKP